MKKVLTAILLFAACIAASAQRTVAESPFVCVEGGIPFGTKGFSAEASYGKYTLGGYWDVRASFLNMVKTTSGLGNEYDVVQYYGSADYMWRLLGTWNRVLNFYAGTGVMLGMESIDPRNVLSGGEVVEGSTEHFLYGAVGTLSAELYVFPNFSLCFSARGRFIGGSRYGALFSGASAGVRISF